MPDKIADLSFSLEATVAGIVSEAENAIRTLNEAAGPVFKPLARLLLRTESIASSKVEGMQLGVREFARAEAHVQDGQKAGPTAMEVLANIEAMTVALNEATQVERFDVPQITAIHKQLLERDKKVIAGKIRQRQNWIGGNDHNPCGADFVPPPPEEVPALLEDLCAAINDDVLPPLVQAALVHAQFETIHPFDNGNGRTGRALIHVVLRRRNLAPRYLPPISVVLAGAKNRYIGGLTQFRMERVEAWVEYFAAAMVQAAYLANEYVKATEALRAEWRERLSQSSDAPRSDAAAWTLIDALPAYPIITASAAAEATGRAVQRIYQAIEQLTAAQILIPLSTSKRNQSWEASGLLELIARMEAGELPTR